LAASRIVEINSEVVKQQSGHAQYCWREIYDRAVILQAGWTTLQTSEMRPQTPTIILQILK